MILLKNDEIYIWIFCYLRNVSSFFVFNFCKTDVNSAITTLLYTITENFPMFIHDLLRCWVIFVKSLYVQNYSCPIFFVQVTSKLHFKMFISIVIYIFFASVKCINFRQTASACNDSIVSLSYRGYTINI